MNEAFIQSARRLIGAPDPPENLSWPNWHEGWALLGSPEGCWIRDLACSPSADGKNLCLRWRAVPKCRGYEIQATPDPAQPRSWSPLSQVSEPCLESEILGTGRTWIRIRALFRAQTGPWSDPIPVTGPAQMDEAEAA